jgi:hypothetical protein
MLYIVPSLLAGVGSLYLTQSRTAVGKIVIGSVQITQEDREKSTFNDVVQ